MSETIRFIHELLDKKDIWTWLVIFAIAILFTSTLKLVLKVASVRLRRAAENTAQIWDDIAVDLLDGTKYFVIFIWTFFLLLMIFKISDEFTHYLRVMVVALTAYQVWAWGTHIIRSWRTHSLQKKIEKDASSAAALGMLYLASQTIFFSTIFLIGLSNMGVDIGALLAGLGVGGIAIALAAQNILGDLLASLSIVLDRPFVVGDLIVVGTDIGTVEHIGIKTTRVRSNSGEELVFSNKDLLESRVRNFKKMVKRRVDLKIGVTYSTPPEVLEKIPTWLKNKINEYSDLEFERCNLAEFGDSALNIELVFWVKNSDFLFYKDLQEKILLDILKKFASEKVDLAFPTRTVFMKNV